MVDALIHVVRCFHDEDVVHVSGDVDPLGDIATINTELILADIDVLDRAAEKANKLVRSGDKEAMHRVAVIEKVTSHLNQGNMLRSLPLDRDEKALISELGLITAKPVLYLANIDEKHKPDTLLARLTEYAEGEQAQFMYIVGKLEEEISELAPEEKREYLEAMGLDESGLDRLVMKAYRLLNLITYYTAATDLQAWTVKEGTHAQVAAGKIHSDFARGFIRAEVFTYETLSAHGSEHTLREHGLIRSEGKDYVIKDGDIIKYLFNV
jgi:GTP-binding protein YchF